MTAATIYLYCISLAVVSKFILEHRFGAARYCSTGSFTEFLNIRYFHEGFSLRVDPGFYRISYCIKWVGALLLPMGGFASLIGGLLCAYWFFRVEIQYDYKHHTIFIGLNCVLVSFIAPSGLLLGGALDQGSVLWTKCAALLLISQIYWSSAYIKILSPMFTSGQVLHSLYFYLWDEQYRLRIRETRIPSFLTKPDLGSLNQRRFFKGISVTAIFLELLVPVLLIIPAPGAWMGAFLLGVAMHLGFQIILPTRLIPFFLASMSLYLICPSSPLWVS